MFRRPARPPSRKASPIALWGILLLLVLAAAGFGQARAQEYRFGPGDVLTITIFGQEGLSGQYKVSTSGSISYPLLGEVPVAGLTRSDLELQVGGLLSQQVPSLGRISVEVAQYAPVFVVGDIEQPGRQEFRPGMTVLELIALGGGLRRPTLQSVGDPILQMISLEQELYDLRLVRYGQAAERARLLAEMAGETFAGTIDPAEEQTITLAHKLRIVEDEQTLFRVRAEVLANREQALKEQHASFDQEIRALTEGIALHDQELSYLTQELNSAQRLVDRGLATQPRLLALKREVAATKRNALEMESFLARSRQHQLAVELQIEELHNTRANEVAIELRDLDMAIARADERLSTIGSTLLELRARGGVRSPDAIDSVTYEVVRLEEGEYRTLPVGERDFLKPLDILQVRREPADPGLVSSLLESPLPGAPGAAATVAAQ